MRAEFISTHSASPQIGTRNSRQAAVTDDKPVVNSCRRALDKLQRDGAKCNSRAKYRWSPAGLIEGWTPVGGNWPRYRHDKAVSQLTAEHVARLL